MRSVQIRIVFFMKKLSKNIYLVLEFDFFGIFSSDDVPVPKMWIRTGSGTGSVQIPLAFGFGTRKCDW